jgi:hypothetical protein
VLGVYSRQLKQTTAARLRLGKRTRDSANDPAFQPGTLDLFIVMEANGAGRLPIEVRRPWSKISHTADTQTGGHALTGGVVVRLYGDHFPDQGQAVKIDYSAFDGDDAEPNN